MITLHKLKIARCTVLTELIDHTWVETSSGFCCGCPDGRAPFKGGRGCKGHDRGTGEYHAFPGNDRSFRCMSRDIAPGPFNIPAQIGIYYGMNGVCHQMTNRFAILGGIGSTDLFRVHTRHVNGGLWGALAWGLFGELVPAPAWTINPALAFKLFIVSMKMFWERARRCGAAATCPLWVALSRSNGRDPPLGRRLLSGSRAAPWTRLWHEEFVRCLATLRGFLEGAGAATWLVPGSVGVCAGYLPGSPALKRGEASGAAVLAEESPAASLECSMSADELAALSVPEKLAVAERSYERRRAHIDWLIDAGATGTLRGDKLDRLRAVVHANHRPTAEALVAPSIEASGLSLSRQVDRVEAGWKRYNDQLVEAIGRDDFKKVFGHAPEALDNPLRVFWPCGDEAP